jgi:hypothetical protein
VQGHGRSPDDGAFVPLNFRNTREGFRLDGVFVHVFEVLEDDDSPLLMHIPNPKPKPKGFRKRRRRKPDHIPNRSHQAPRGRR